MSESPDLAEHYHQLFFDQLIGVTPGQKRLQYQLKTAQTSERTLLAVEAAARQARMADAKAKLQFTEFAQAHLHDQVADELFRRLGNIEQVVVSLTDLGAEFYPVLDTLSTKIVLINRLDQHISQCSWLAEDLLRLVNQPQYRNRNTSGPLVKDIKTALRFIGVESLQLIVPVYAMRRCLPHSTDPFTGFKNRLWEYSLATAIAARQLAENTAENPQHAFCSGLFHTLGHIVVCRNYLKVYQQVKQNELLKAREARDTELTDALDGLEPDASFLSNCLQEFAAILSADISSRWQLKTLPLCQTLDQIAEGSGFSGSSPLTRLVQQAQVYVQCQQLKQAALIDDADTELWFKSVKLQHDHINMLARTNLKRLNIEM